MPGTLALKEVESLKVHRVADELPRMSDDVFADTMESIRVGGLDDPVVLWRDDDGARWLIDGRNRMWAWLALAQGKMLPERFSELPFVEISGDEESAINFIRRRSLLRRDLSSGQRACLAVIFNERLREYLDRRWRRDRNASGIGADGPGYTPVQKVASAVGSTPTNIYNANRLYSKAPELFKEVTAGTVGMNDAVAEMKKRLGEDGPEEPRAASDEPITEWLPPREPVPVSPNGTPEAGVDEDDPVYDGEGAVVADEFHEIFESRLAFAEMVRAIGAVKKGVKSLAAGIGGHYVRLKEVTAHLGNAELELRLHQPHAVCPSCRGSGEKCEACGGCKYVDKIQKKEK